MSPLLFIAAHLVACDGSSPPAVDGPPASAPDQASLVLVTMDTTRADRIGAYGYAPAQTPNLDGFAGRGARFERAWAVVPLTTPSHATMLSGLYPPRHGVHTNGDAAMPDEISSLAEILSAEGWRTAASVSAFVTTRVWNLDQGFGVYLDDVEGASQEGNRWTQERPADQTVDDAIGWLEGLDDGAPFFLWVHLYDPHAPYAPPAPYDENGRPYDGEIAFMDSQIGRLRDAVRSAAGPAGAHWILTADHGEALSGEHGEPGHGVFLFDPSMRIPFIVEPAGGLAEPLVVDDVDVSGADVMPTALGLLGQPVPEGLDGVDLSPRLRGEPVVRDGVFMEAWGAAQRFGYHPEISWVDWPLKLMDTPNPRLFDLSADPAESQNVIADHPADAERMRAAARAVVASEVDAADRGEVPSDVIEKLAALGYIGAGQPVDAGLDSQLDAKDHLDTIGRLHKAMALSQTGQSDAAEALYREVLAAEPQIAEARLGLVRVLEREGRLQEAEASLREALEREPGSASLHQNLSNNLLRQGQLDEALAESAWVLERVPGDRSAQITTLRILTWMGREGEALERARGWLDATPESAELNAQVGLILARLGEGSAAAPHLEASLSDGVARPFVHEILARVATEQNDVSAARAHIEAELEHFPTNAAARWALANMLLVDQDWEEAAAEYRYITEQSPSPYPARRLWAQAVFNARDYARAESILAPWLAEQPLDPHGWMLQANILAMTERVAEGEAARDEAQRLYALSPNAQNADRREPVGVREFGVPEAP